MDEVRRFKRRAWTLGFSAFAVFWVVDALWGAQLGIYPTGDSGPPAITRTSLGPSVTGMPALINDPSQPDWMIQGFWYCWNSQPVLPHHLDHHVPGDHLCTWGELRDSGFAYMP